MFSKEKAFFLNYTLKNNKHLIFFSCLVSEKKDLEVSLFFSLDLLFVCCFFTSFFLWWNLHNLIDLLFNYNYSFRWTFNLKKK